MLEKYEEQVEWSQAALEAQFGEHQINCAQEAFVALDTDGSGLLHASELRTLLTQLGHESTQAEMEVMIAEVGE